MSLNSPEIDRILEELPLVGGTVRKVLQPDFKNLYFQIYAPATPVWWFRIALEHPRVRIHRTDHPPRAKRSRQRFEDFLHAKIEGGRITDVEHVHHDRIVRIEVTRDGRPSHVYVRLWGTRANVVVTDDEHRILDVCFRKPKEGLETGGTFRPVDPGQDNAGRSVRERDPSLSFNEQIDREYHEAEYRAHRERAAARLTTLLHKKRRRTAARLAEIERGRSNVDAGAQNRRYGDLILSSIHLISPGDEWVDVVDYEDNDRPVRIQLDPRLDGAHNAQRYYDRAKRAEESGAYLDAGATALQHRLEGIDETLAALDEMDLPAIRELLKEEEQDNRGDQSAKGETPGLEFESRGFTIIVGRNAKENDRLLRGRVRGNDWWLHTRDYAGGYVFIRNRPGKSVPLDVLLDAGNLALFFSKGRSNGKADLYYTQVKHLRRAKDGPVGLVIPTQEKNLFVELDAERLRRLGIGGTI